MAFQLKIATAQSNGSIDWTMVAGSLSSRTNRDCRKRWLRIGYAWNSGVWDEQEDECLRQAVNIHQNR